MTLETIMEAGIIAGSVILMLFCITLARRLRRLNDLEGGLGGAIAILTAEVDRLDQSIRQARQEAMTAGETLAVEVAKAQTERARWDLHLRMREVVPPEPPRGLSSRLRKRRVPVDA
ncbi:MAG: hypothetical protein ACK5IP_16330 [Paracoccus sp. (in: a-proteobacteria)]